MAAARYHGSGRPRGSLSSAILAPTGARPLPCLHCGLEPSARWLAKLLVPSLKKRRLSSAVRKGSEERGGLGIVQFHGERPIRRDRRVGSVKTAQFAERFPCNAHTPKLPLEIVQLLLVVSDHSSCVPNESG